MVPQRLDFGIFMAPFHRIPENPTLALRRDLDLISLLDRLGYNEAWVGEHHSGGWETIASPEVFLAAAGERTTSIRLGTGVVSIPYHHPLNVADRIVLLDHLTQGRAMLGVGPGQLPTDAHMLGIDPNTQRARMDEGLGVIIRLLTEDEPITYKCDWFELNEAQLQLKPLQRPTMPIAVASTISPSGMTTAGKHRAGVLSVASYSEAGLNALTTQWNYAVTAAREHGQPEPNRTHWRVVMPFHLAETRDKAIDEVEHGLLAWQNDYFAKTFGVYNNVEVESGRKLAEQLNGVGFIIGTPDDAIERITKLQELSGGFGCFLGLAHEWASTEATHHSFELMARYVMPEFQDSNTWIRRSNLWTKEHKEDLIGGARSAIQKAIKDHYTTHPTGDAAQAPPHG
ncbi:MAG: LLM class flavin-dependent oxidoreductase [Chloroflexota bacterium]|nr:LLM class flavin-dependent oxidoreductase [Chloroflexota bacterium]